MVCNLPLRTIIQLARLADTDIISLFLSYATALGGVAAPHLAACQEVAMGGLVDRAFKALENGVRAAATASNMPACTMGARVSKTPCPSAPFFDAECRQLRQQVRASARHGGDPTEVRDLDRAYHYTVRTERRAYRLGTLHDLLSELRSNLAISKTAT